MSSRGWRSVEAEKRNVVAPSNSIIFSFSLFSLSLSLSLPHLFSRRPHCSCRGHDGFRVHLEEVCERVHGVLRRLEGVSRDRKKNFPSEKLCFEDMVLPLLFFLLCATPSFLSSFLLFPFLSFFNHMSWFTAAAVQLVLTSMTLGALKNRGVIS